jgi:hypothetical protein
MGSETGVPPAGNDDTDEIEDGSQGDPGTEPGAGQQPGQQPDPRVKKANDEAKNRRLENKALRSELATVKTQLTEIANAFKAEKEARETAQREALAASRKAAAIKFGLPEKFAERLTGATPAEIEADAESLAKELPAKPAPNNGTPPASPGNPAAPPTLTIDQINAMTPDQINANWEAVQKVLETQK